VRVLVAESAAGASPPVGRVAIRVGAGKRRLVVLAASYVAGINVAVFRARAVQRVHEAIATSQAYGPVVRRPGAVLLPAATLYAAGFGITGRKNSADKSGAEYEGEK
jgi:hypothetical protein